MKNRTIVVGYKDGIPTVKNFPVTKQIFVPNWIQASKEAAKQGIKQLSQDIAYEQGHPF